MRVSGQGDLHNGYFEDPHDPAVESGPISPPGLTTGCSVWDYFVLMLVGGKVSAKWK